MYIYIYIYMYIFLTLFRTGRCRPRSQWRWPPAPGGPREAQRAWSLPPPSAAPAWPALLSHTKCFKSFGTSQFPRKSVNPSFTVTDIKNKLTDCMGLTFAKRLYKHFLWYARCAESLITPTTLSSSCVVTGILAHKKHPPRWTLHHPKFYAEQLWTAMAPMHYLSGNFDPLWASISPKICETDVCNCSASNLG